MSPFSCPIFLGHPIRERPLLPRRAGAFWQPPRELQRWMLLLP